MSDASERQVNLALYLASRRTCVTAAECRVAGLGYPDGQDDAAFGRMFERDKDTLRAIGLGIEMAHTAEGEAYRIDPLATFARPIDLSDAEIAAIRTIAATLADDPGFPFRDDLVLALGKLETGGERDAVAAAGEARVSRDGETGAAAVLADAIRVRKTATFTYTNAGGATKLRQVDPYGMHVRGGCWYLTGYDHPSGEVRTFALSRMADVSVNAARPRTPDFERPADFNIRNHERLPFQYGGTPFVARLRFAPAEAWRAPRLALGHGTIEDAEDGSAFWTVEAASLERLAEWIVDSGPGVAPVDPPELVAALKTYLRKVVAIHG